MSCGLIVQITLQRTSGLQICWI